MLASSQASSILRRWSSIAFIGFLVIMVIAALVQFAPMGDSFGWDWIKYFRPSVRLMLELKSPYNGSVFHPPWALISMLPLALLPEKVGAAIFAVVNLTAISFTALRLGAKPFTVFAIILTPTALLAICSANIDGLVMLGAVLPPQIGLFFVLAKPQMGIGIAVYWLFVAYQRGGVRECVRIFGPFMIVLILSFMVFGLYPLQYQTPINLTVNMSLWPYSLPVGILLLVLAIWKRRITFAGTSSLCFAPYTNFQNWTISLFTLLPSQIWTFALCIVQWVIFTIIVISRHAI